MGYDKVSASLDGMCLQSISHQIRPVQLRTAAPM